MDLIKNDKPEDLMKLYYLDTSSIAYVIHEFFKINQKRSMIAFFCINSLFYKLV